MCGIAGFRSIGAYGAPDRLRGITRAMTDTLVHRGPDDAICGSIRTPGWRWAIGGFRSSTCRPPDGSQWHRPAAAS